MSFRFWARIGPVCWLISRMGAFFTGKAALHYSERDGWDRMLHRVFSYSDRFAQDDRIRIRQPRRNLQVKFTKPLAAQNDFVAYGYAVGELGGTRCLLGWKTTASRYPEEPCGLLALDPQLVCYSWVTGISDVGQVVFVRERHEFLSGLGKQPL